MGTRLAKPVIAQVKIKHARLSSNTIVSTGYLMRKIFSALLHHLLGSTPE
jgi:hypothetical protein